MKHAFLILALLVALPAMAQSGHDGQAFWLPLGQLKVGDAASEKDFTYSSTGKSLAWTTPKPKEGTEGGDAVVSFVIGPGSMRMHMPAGQFVLVRLGSLKESPEFAVNGEPAGRVGQVTFIPGGLKEGQREVKIEIRGTSSSSQAKDYLIYYTDDADKLGTKLAGDLAAQAKSAGRPLSAYQAGMSALWSGNYKGAKSSLQSGAKAAATAQSARLFRRLGRWSDANIQFGKLKTGQGFYDLGLYSMTNGFWELAADCFRKATELMPKNPDAWYMLGDAMSYATSDLDMKMEKIAPYYQKAAELYPTGGNTYRNHVGLFRNLRLNKDQVAHMSDEEIAYVKQVWDWCAAIFAASSRGAIRMVNDYVIYDKEFDNSGDMDPRPFEGIFPRGSTETFMKFTGWGASVCFGHDCGPNRSAETNIGLRGWEVMFHEWNHSLDWAMIEGELGIGVPVTHSSDSCGFQPVSSMGMGHHSCTRYYMTPGMYRYVRGSDPPATPFITDWLAWPLQSLGADIAAEKFADKDQTFIQDWAKKTRAAVAEAAPPTDSPQIAPKVEDGYLNFKTTWPDAPKNAYAFVQSYVYSPKKQKVRMWVGADDNLRIWLNGRLIHKGLYWAVCVFQEAKEKDQTAKGVVLEQGWNELVVQVTNMQHADVWYYSDPRPDQWGFSIRICDMYNKEVPGLKYQSGKPSGFTLPPPEFVVDPKAPKTYTWEKVADDYTTLLPCLTIDDLRAITGYNTLKANDDMLFDLSGESIDPAFRSLLIQKSDQSDLTLNNELNWFIWPREMAAVIRYNRGSQVRDLLFLRPEAYETYLTLMPVNGEAKKLGIKRHADQVIGYFSVPRDDFPNGRVVLVVDTYLGKKMPADEEELLDIASLR